MKSVIGVVLSPSRQEILLILRRDVDVWVLPGGGIDGGEEPEVAVTREILEESGLETEVVRLIGEYLPVNRLAKHTYLFETKVLGGQLTTGEETRSAQFFPLDKLPKNLFKIHKIFLDDALKSGQIPFKRELTEVNYWEVLKYFIQHPYTLIRYAFTWAGYPLNK